MAEKDPCEECPYSEEAGACESHGAIWNRAKGWMPTKECRPKKPNHDYCRNPCGECTELNWGGLNNEEEPIRKYCTVMRNPYRNIYWDD